MNKMKNRKLLFSFTAILALMLATAFVYAATNGVFMLSGAALYSGGNVRLEIVDADISATGRSSASFKLNKDIANDYDNQIAEITVDFADTNDLAKFEFAVENTGDFDAIINEVLVDGKPLDDYDGVVQLTGSYVALEDFDIDAGDKTGPGLWSMVIQLDGDHPDFDPANADKEYAFRIEFPYEKY